MFKKIMRMMAAVLPLFIAGQAIAAERSLAIPGDHGMLSAILQTPDGKDSWPVVMLMHGFGGSKEAPLLNILADDLESRGIASLRFDFNGHGKSEGAFRDMTVSNEIEDAKRVLDYLSRLPGAESVSAAGHSQGGLVAGMLAGMTNGVLKSVVLFSPASVIRDDAVRGLLFGKRYDPMDPPETVRLGRGIEVGRAYIQAVQAMPIYETAARYSGPVCVIHGMRDTVVPYTCSLHYNHAFSDCELHILPGLGHLFAEDRAGTAKLAADFFAAKLR